jgi:hypothetical protein
LRCIAAAAIVTKQQAAMPFIFLAAYKKGNNRKLLPSYRKQNATCLKKQDFLASAKNMQ